jgi:hypothetical protein
MVVVGWWMNKGEPAQGFQWTKLRYSAGRRPRFSRGGTGSRKCCRVATAQQNGAAVVGLADRVSGLAGCGVVAVHEIEIGIVGDAFPQRMRAHLAHAVPAHLRHLEARAVGLQLAVELEAHHLARQQAQAGRVAFSRSSRTASARRRTRPSAAWSAARSTASSTPDSRRLRMQSRIAPWPGSTTRSARRCRRLRRYAYIGFRRDRAQRLRHRAQVAHAVIDYNDLVHVRN